MFNIITFFRVKDWLHILGLILLGFIYSPHRARIDDLPLTLLIGALYLAHGYSLNDIYDDQIKAPTLNKQAMRLSLISLLFCLVASTFISLQFFCVVVFGHLSGMFYSAQPFRFKNKLWLDLIFNSFSLAPLFLLGCLINNNISLRSIAVTALFFLYFIPIQLLHQMNDNKTDRECRQDNTFQILGFKKTKKLISAFLTAFAIFSLLLWQTNILSWLSAMLSLLFAAALISYMDFKFSPKTLPVEAFFNRLKLDARYISILYGCGLFLSFYRLSN